MPPVPNRHPPGTVSGDGIEPTRKGLRGCKLRQCFEGDQERLLGDVLGQLLAADSLTSHGGHCIAKPPDQLVERAEIAEKRPDHQFVVFDTSESRSAAPHLTSLPWLRDDRGRIG